MKRKYTPWIILAAVSLMIAWPLQQLNSFMEEWRSGGPTIEFDSETWKKSLTNNNRVKIRMIENLLDTHKLEGLSKTEIDKLLGVPPPSDYYQDYDYVYWLGPERSFISVDSEWLCLKFKNEKVVEARLRTD